MNRFLITAILFTTLIGTANAAGSFPWGTIRDLGDAPAWAGSGCFGLASGPGLSCVSTSPIECSIGVAVVGGNPIGWFNMNHSIPGWRYETAARDTRCGGNPWPAGHGRWRKNSAT